MAKKRIELENEEYVLVHRILDQLMELSIQKKAEHELHPGESVFDTYVTSIRLIKETLTSKR